MLNFGILNSPTPRHDRAERSSGGFFKNYYLKKSLRRDNKMESFPNLFWSFRSAHKSAQAPCDLTETRASRLCYKIVAALFLIFFVIDELVDRYRENRYGKYSAGKKKLSAMEFDSEI